MTEETVNTRKEICNTCEKCVYEVLPNMFLCSEKSVPIQILVEQEDPCPLGKW
jgi:hypothetical protein